MTKTLASLLCLAALSAVCAGDAGLRQADREVLCTRTLRAGGDLQQALERIATSERPATLCLGEGEFRLERFVSIDRNGLTLRGRGVSTILRLGDGTPSPVIVVDDYAHATPEKDVSNVTIEDSASSAGAPPTANSRSVILI